MSGHRAIESTSQKLIKGILFLPTRKLSHGCAYLWSDPNGSLKRDLTLTDHPPSVSSGLRQLPSRWMKISQEPPQRSPPLFVFANFSPGNEASVNFAVSVFRCLSSSVQVLLRAIAKIEEVSDAIVHEAPTSPAQKVRRLACSFVRSPSSLAPRNAGQSQHRCAVF